MKILGFTGTVTKVKKYMEIENKSKFSKEPKTFMCNVTVKEVGQGLARVGLFHNISLQMNEEDYNNKIIEKGDRIKILDNAMWHPDRPVEYTIRTKEKIKGADKSTLEKDEKGYTVSKTVAYPYSIRCKQDQWQMLLKWDEQNYCTIEKSRIKLPLEDHKQFKVSKELSFFLDPQEMTIIAPLAGEVVKVISYSNKNKNGEKQMFVTLENDNEAGTNYLTLSEVENEG